MHIKDIISKLKSFNKEEVPIEEKIPQFLQQVMELNAKVYDVNDLMNKLCGNRTSNFKPIQIFSNYLKTGNMNIIDEIANNYEKLFGLKVMSSGTSYGTSIAFIIEGIVLAQYNKSTIWLLNVMDEPYKGTESIEDNSTLRYRIDNAKFKFTIWLDTDTNVIRAQIGVPTIVVAGIYYDADTLKMVGHYLI